jgi:hypothetical protein
MLSQAKSAEKLEPCELHEVAEVTVARNQRDVIVDACLRCKRITKTRLVTLVQQHAAISACPLPISFTEWKDGDVGEEISNA